MTATSATITFDSHTSDATFRAWVSAISTNLQAVGLIKTADTGQINLATVVRTFSVGGEILHGYEIYRFNDALQATRPVFFKIEYGHAATGVGTAIQGPTSPAIYVTVGSATDGAGTITGALQIPRTRVSGGSSASTGSSGGAPSQTSPCYFSGDGSYIVMALGVTAGIQVFFNGISSCLPVYLVIDRSRDNAGAATSQGIFMATAKWPAGVTGALGTLVSTYQVVSYTNSVVSAQETYWPVAFPGQLFASSSSGTDYAVWPMPLATPAASQVLSILGIYKGEIAVGATIALSVLGSSHTYVSMGAVSAQSAGDAARGQINAAVPSGTLLMRYE